MKEKTSQNQKSVSEKTSQNQKKCKFWGQSEGFYPCSATF
jgi:hypothetical protein